MFRINLPDYLPGSDYKYFRHSRAGGNPVTILVRSTAILTLRVMNELDSRLRENDANQLNFYSHHSTCRET